MGEPGDGLARFFGVELEAAAEKRAGPDIAEQNIGVGDGRLVAAAAVAGGARHRAGAVRPDLEQTQPVARGDAAAASADLDHLDRLDLQREPAAAPKSLVPGNFKLAADHRLAVGHQTKLGG